MGRPSREIDLNCANPSLLHISSLVGIDLRCSIDMVDKNLETIRKMEIARREIYFQNIAGKRKEEEGIKYMESKSYNTPVHINTGDVNVAELCSDIEHSDAEMEEQQYLKLRAIFTGRKSNKICSPALSCVK